MGPGIAIGDVNGDGLEDVYVSRPKGQVGRVYQRTPGVKNGDKAFTANAFSPFMMDESRESMASLFFDLDNDGDLDLYGVSGGVEGEPGDTDFADRLYLNNAHEASEGPFKSVEGDFSRAPAGMLPEENSSNSVVCAADYDRDGDLDLFVGGRVVPGRYPESPRSRILRNEAGKKFTAISAELFSGMVTSALWSDVDNDGWLDLLVTTEWGAVKLYHNQKGKLVERTKESGLADRLGWWNSIAGGDLDRDGDIDYVVGNVGLNTKYDAPAVLYYGDIDSSGKKRILEAEIEGGKVFPIRGLGCSSDAMPWLRKKTPKFHDFASAALSDLYDGLDKATRYEANTLASGVLVNDGKGAFEFKPLPAMAQVAPVFGIAISDFDADGKLDVFLAQNSHAPQVETGRMDGGVGALLKGKGDGTFTAISPRESGIVVPGDAKGVALTDLNGDGKPDLLVANNNADLQVFEHNPDSADRFLKVDLDAPGHLTTGARITVELQDGNPIVHEVYAGGGYLSQSSPIPRIGLRKSDQLKSISVRWADGTESLTEPHPDAKEVTLAPQETVE